MRTPYMMFICVYTKCMKHFLEFIFQLVYFNKLKLFLKQRFPPLADIFFISVHKTISVKSAIRSFIGRNMGLSKKERLQIISRMYTRLCTVYQ